MTPKPPGFAWSPVQNWEICELKGGLFGEPVKAGTSALRWLYGQGRSSLALLSYNLCIVKVCCRHASVYATATSCPLMAANTFVGRTNA